MKPRAEQKTPNHPWRHQPGCVFSPKARDEFEKRRVPSQPGGKKPPQPS